VLEEADRTESGVNTSPLAWVAWGMVGALTGILGLWALIVAFFLLYPPVYLLGKAPLLIGRSGWVDRREARFLHRELPHAGGARRLPVPRAAPRRRAVRRRFGCGPMFWRALV